LQQSRRRISSYQLQLIARHVAIYWSDMLLRDVICYILLQYHVFYMNGTCRNFTFIVFYLFMCISYYRMNEMDMRLLLKYKIAVFCWHIVFDFPFFVAEWMILCAVMRDNWNVNFVINFWFLRLYSTNIDQKFSITLP
jgi:hypothetical protein